MEQTIFDREELKWRIRLLNSPLPMAHEQEGPLHDGVDDANAEESDGESWSISGTLLDEPLKKSDREKGRNL